MNARYPATTRFHFVLPLAAACLIPCLSSHGQTAQRGGEIYGEFAPPDAYVDGARHPYYGSENPWDRRFFNEQTNQYSRRGQRQMLLMVEGKYDEAARYCRELLESDPSDLESLFNLAAAEARLGNITGALEQCRRAVELGLPIERFLAGPRDVLQPLLESDAFKSFAAQRPVELIHGPILGCVTDRSASFWVRTARRVAVKAVLSRTPDFADPIPSAARETEPGQDYTAVIQVDGLQPQTTYHYRLMVEGRPTLESGLSFTTYPTPEHRNTFQVAFGGGAGYLPANERMWDLIRQYEPSAFLFLGDNVYIDLPSQPNGLHHYTYYRRQSRPEFRRMTASIPIYAIWDDHDCAMDDVWMGPYRDKPDWKMPLFRVFRQNWNNPAYGAADWPGCWFRFSIGPVDFFMLDCRFYRTNPYEPLPTMLGPVQKAWLKKELLGATGTFKVLVSSVPWAYESKAGVKDTWNGYRAERDEIFDFLAGNRIDGVILLSADRHRSEAWRIERPNAYPLYEFESSRLTNEPAHDLVPGALFGYNARQSFGLLRFALDQPDPSVRFEIISIDNDRPHDLTVRRSQLVH